MSKVLSNRVELVVLVDVKNGNPNGNPDADGRPRVCSATGKGEITPVCLKRKIRNYIQKVYGKEPGKDIFFQEGVVLNDLISKPYDTEDSVKKAFEAKKKGDRSVNPEEVARKILCRDYFDIRTFGAVLSTGDEEKADSIEVTEDSEEKATKGKKTGKALRKTAGRVRGPVQVTFAESIDKIHPDTSVSITRGSVTNESDKDKERTMGSMYRIPYALYRFHVYVSANDAGISGFSDDDLKLLKEAIMRMFDDDRSTSRGEMVVRKAVCFTHVSQFGNSPAHKNFERVTVVKNEKVVGLPTSYDDYSVSVKVSDLPSGVTITELEW